MPVRASAPGKIILFGEHAVVYGEPSLSLALDRRIRIEAEEAPDGTVVNGEPLDPHRHAYIRQALRLAAPHRAFRLRNESDLPSAGGVGSSAALSVATVAAALRVVRGHAAPLHEVASLAFETEWTVQGAASPNDTSVATAGGAVLLSPDGRDPGVPLWKIERGERTWNVHRIELPRLPLVVAHTGMRARTADQVAIVRRLLDTDPSAREVLRDIGRITRQGVAALLAGDLSRVGALMDRNHACLHALGVDTPQLARLTAAARAVPGTYGAKLTGAGGGGSLIVLTDNAADVQSTLQRLGASAFAAVAGARGLEVSP